jgi:hypothetical protein
MPGEILTTASTVKCMHGGTAILLTTNTRVRAAGAFALLETDVHPVVGCPFTVGPKYSPCVRIEWTAGASQLTVGAKVLLRSSVGKCLNAENAPQGVAIVAAVQPKVTAR